MKLREHAAYLDDAGLRVPRHSANNLVHDGTSRQPTMWQWPSCLTTSSTIFFARSASFSSLGRNSMPTLQCCTHSIYFLELDYFTCISE